MKIDRLMGILTILLKNGKVTAPYLAEKFEVSRRTINRDIEDLCKAGVPVVTTQGTGGGIALAEGYTIDTALFTREEIRDILAGLGGLDSVAQDNRYKRAADKLAYAESRYYMQNHVLIDLSSHYKDTLAPKIAAIREAAEQRLAVVFQYHSRRGKHRVELEPCLVLFRWGNWYAFGVDCASQAFKMYKLNRLWYLQTTGRTFEPREIPAEQLDPASPFSDDIQAVILFDRREAYRLVEEYGVDCFVQENEEQVRFSFPFTSEEYLISWVLSFGGRAELLEPRPLREELKKRLRSGFEKYE